jgi:preprotein translocase subunit YajC
MTFLLSFSSLLMPVLAAGEAQPPQNNWVWWLPLALMVAFYYVLLIRPQQKERGKRQELLNSLKKNDRVVTTSGMVGTVANISQDGKEITLKFGDSTRIPFLRSAIETVLRDETASAETAAKT